jgi:putrescine aminotransferase
MAAARGAIQAIRDDDLVDRARVLGAELLTEIRRILREHFGTALREVRGVGLLLGIEFAEPGPAGDLLIELATQGVVANHSLNSHLTMRLTPPAILGRADVDYLLSAMDRASRMTASRYADMKR